MCVSVSFSIMLPKQYERYSYIWCHDSQNYCKLFKHRVKNLFRYIEQEKKLKKKEENPYPRKCCGFFDNQSLGWPSTHKKKQNLFSELE